MWWGYTQRSEEYQDRLRIDASGHLEQNVVLPSDCEGLHFRGLWTLLPFGNVMLFGWQGQLQLVIEGHPLMLLRECRINWRFDKVYCHAWIDWRDETFMFKYINEAYLFRYRVRDYDFTPFIEPEDFDLLLMATKIIEDPAWHARLEGSWAKQIPDVRA